MLKKVKYILLISNLVKAGKLVITRFRFTEKWAQKVVYAVFTFFRK